MPAIVGMVIIMHLLMMMIIKDFYMFCVQEDSELKDDSQPNQNADTFSCEGAQIDQQSFLCDNPPCDDDHWICESLLLLLLSY